MKPRFWYGLNCNINPLGFGCWQLSGPCYINGTPHGWGNISEKEAIRLIHHAIDNGIQLFDTAASYGNGRSEQLLGKAINTCSNKSNVFVCTKIELSESELHKKSLRDAFLKKADDSLSRLGRDYIDVLLIHAPPDDLRWSELDIWALDKLKKEGKIRTYGVSSRSIYGLLSVIDSGFGSCVEWTFHLLERRPVDWIFPKLANSNINFIARSPLARGLLSNKYLKENPAFCQDEFRSTLPKEWVNWVITSIRNINHFDIISNIDLSELALRYCLSFEEVSAVIPGINKTKHLVSALHAEKKGVLNQQILTFLANHLDSHYEKWK